MAFLSSLPIINKKMVTVKIPRIPRIPNLKDSKIPKFTFKRRKCHSILRGPLESLKFGIWNPWNLKSLEFEIFGI
jgi:hypothetical protein